MPWEVDCALLMYNQLAKSIPHFNKNDNISFEACLNLSSYIINWEETKLPKEFFIEKYKNLDNILKDKIQYNTKIYDGDELYGHLNSEKESISSEIEGYITICPDIWFSEFVLAYMIEGAKQIPNKYYVITPQIAKLWDNTWDVLVNPIYHNVPYENYLQQDIFNIIYNQTYSTQETELKPTPYSKYAGWFDFYSKSYCVDLAPIGSDWSGYGGWDLYSMTVADYCKNKGLDYQQYVLEGQTIHEYGKLNYTNVYKKYITLNQIPSQRENFKEKTPQYIKERIEYLINNKII